MKKLITSTFVVILLVSYNLSFGQAPESDSLTYRAYLGGKDITEAKAFWKEAVQKREEALKTNAEDKNSRYRLALAQFGLLTATMRDQDEDLFDAYNEQTQENLDVLMKDKRYKAEAAALLAAVYGLEMGYSPWKGMYLGSKSGGLLEKALKENPSSPLVWKLYANSRLFTPDSFGGDVNEAIEAYTKAIQLYETHKEATENNWFYLDAMAFLGQAYAKNGDNKNAILWYEKALQIEPDYNWVKYALLPAMRK